MRNFWDLWLVMGFFSLSYALPWMGVFLLLLFAGYFLVSRQGTRPLVPLVGRLVYGRPH
jgi:hypothetical protein